MMKSYTINFNKNKYKIQADNLKAFKAAVFEEISVPPENLKIIKPSVKQNDEAAFSKIPDGAEILVMGASIEKLKKLEKTVENGIKYHEFIGYITYVTSSVQLLRSIKEFKEFCMAQTDEDDPDKLMAIDLGKIFKELDCVTLSKPVSPIDIMTSWVAYSDKFEENYGVNLSGVMSSLQEEELEGGIELTDGGKSKSSDKSAEVAASDPNQLFEASCSDFPYRTLDAIDFLMKIFEMMQYAANPKFDDEEEAPNFIHDLFRLKYSALETDKSCEIENVLKLETEVRTRTMWMIPCEIDNKISSVSEGVFRYFEAKRMLVRQVYGVDVNYQEQIKGITYFPQYIFIRVNRFGKKEGEKLAKEIQYTKTLDLTPLCHKDTLKSLEEGKKLRDTAFEAFVKTPEFEQYEANMKKMNPNMTEMELKYSYYEKKMTPEDYEIYVNRSPAAKTTGDYNLLGLLTHMGKKIDDSGYFRAVVNRKGRDWFIFNEDDVRVTGLSEALSFTGFDDTNGTETAHVLLYKAIKF